MNGPFDHGPAGLDVRVGAVSADMPDMGPEVPERVPVPEISEEIRTLLKSAASEIVMLRNEVNHSTPKAQAYDCIQKILFGMNGGGERGYSVDLVWHIDQALAAAQPTKDSRQDPEDETRPV